MNDVLHDRSISYLSFFSRLINLSQSFSGPLSLFSLRGKHVVAMTWNVPND